MYDRAQMIKYDDGYIDVTEWMGAEAQREEAEALRDAPVLSRAAVTGWSDPNDGATYTHVIEVDSAGVTVAYLVRETAATPNSGRHD